MQIQTTTITTETMESFGANFQITIYEQKMTAFCDCCDNQSTGTKQQLENRGWEMNANCQFCPECNL